MDRPWVILQADELPKGMFVDETDAKIYALDNITDDLDKLTFIAVEIVNVI